jgi:hypothetical protein
VNVRTIRRPTTSAESKRALADLGRALNDLGIKPGEPFCVMAPPTGGTKPRARTSDPDTSHAAARSVAGKVTDSQRAVLAAIRHLGRCTDEELVSVYDQLPPLSPSGIRTRRKELADRGLVRDTGRRTRLRSGRQAVVWTAA